jgi:O-antigen ligase
MKLARELSEAEAKKVQSLILFGGVFTTLAIWTKLEDPVNLPKMFVLVLFGAMVLGLTIPALLGARKSTTGNQKIGLALVGLFVISLLVSTFATDVKYTAIFGEFHRNNGALSYIAMAVLMAASAIAFNLAHVKRYFIFFSGTGLLLTLYGFMQGAGIDPVSWAITYNPYITTLGNPNFVSAALGLSAIVILSLTIASRSNLYKAGYLLGLVSNLYILYRTESIQGFIGFGIGAAIILISKIWLVNKKYGTIAIALAFLMSIPVILALLNIGPLARYIYQTSLQNRLDYWNAAIAMFKENPLLGVGIDRYGEFYREFAVQNQFVQGTVTDNAHSVYLQLLATGGLITAIPYVLLIIFVTFAGVKVLVTSPEAEKFKIASVLAIWIAMLIVNSVTIDNLGVSIWFWITGGVLLSLSAKSSQEIVNENSRGKQLKRNVTNAQSDHNFPVHLVLSFVLAIGVIVLLTPRIEQSTTLFNLKNQVRSSASETFESTVSAEIEKSQNNPQQLIQLANLALTKNLPNEALRIIQRVNEIDKRSYYGNYFAAIAYESKGNIGEAIEYRKKLLKLDPWGTQNMLQLIKNYLAESMQAEAVQIGESISRNYPGSQADIDARALLPR